MIRIITFSAATLFIAALIMKLYEQSDVPQPFWDMDVNFVLKNEESHIFDTVQKDVIELGMYQQVEDFYLQQLVIESPYYRQNGLKSAETQMNMPYSLSVVRKHAKVKIDWDKKVSYFPSRTRKEAFTETIEADHKAITALIELYTFVKPKSQRVQGNNKNRYFIPESVKQNKTYLELAGIIEDSLDSTSEPIYIALADLNSALNYAIQPQHSNLWVDYLLFGNDAKKAINRLKVKAEFNPRKTQRYYDDLRDMWLSSLNSIIKGV